eukprot:PhM_4_TR4094/c0_g1_i1/m.90568/K02257/COX10; protoheme IX farnesyltransferase
MHRLPILTSALRSGFSNVRGNRVHVTTLAAMRPCSSSSSDAAAATAPHKMDTTSGCPVGGFNRSECSVEGDAMPATSQASPFHIVSTLGKLKLTALVSFTAVAGSVMCTAPGLHLIPLALGTTFQGLSANTANQCIEVECDRLMKRTAKRPLVVGDISRPSAMLLSATELAVGTAFLYYYCPAAAALGLVNWGLYVGVYTPMKRRSTFNTEVGAIVGAIPPVMGGILAPAACAPSVWLGAIMLAWQLPHFMALSYFCRRDYNGAGFRMLAFEDPEKAARNAVAYSVLLQAMIMAGPVVMGMPYPVLYYVVSMALSSVMTWKSYLFYTDLNRYCRGCFVYSYLFLAVQLCVLVAAAMWVGYDEAGEALFTSLQAVTSTQQQLEGEKDISGATVQGQSA